MLTVYHNPRCGKSREALKLLDDKGLDYEVRKYMDEPMSPTELEDVLEKLNMTAFDLLRTKEKVWKDEFADKDLDENELILLMIENPRLMERPIVINGDKAVVARPTERIEDIV